MKKETLNCEFCHRDFSGKSEDFRYCQNMICDDCYEKENDKLQNYEPVDPWDGDFENAILEQQEDLSWGV